LIDARAGELLRDAFRSLGDLERILSRVALRSARPRDLSTLRDGLSLLPSVRRSCPDWIRRACRRCTQPWANTRRPRACCARPIVPQPPLLARDGGVIADGYDAELDELRQLSTNADQFLIDLEAREREASGIATLKVGYNRVHGYYIEISKGQSDKAPVHYTRRQTLTGAERYITEELKAFEDKVLSARERALSREKLLYEGVLDLLNRCSSRCALRRRAERTRRAGRLRRARAGAGLDACRCSATSPASRSSAAAIRWSRQCATSRSSPTTCARWRDPDAT
jgi:DNA mismatch repair protein MutS